MLEYLERLNAFVKICEQRAPTQAEVVNARSDVLAAMSLAVQRAEMSSITRCPACGHVHYEKVIYCDVCGAFF
jgi:hypothetical protein